MFETGLSDIITVKKSTITGRSTAGNRTRSWTTIISSQACRVVEHSETMTDPEGNLVVIKTRSVMINYTGSDLNADCMAIINGDKAEIEKVTPARGFGRDFYNIELKDRDE